MGDVMAYTIRNAYDKHLTFENLIAAYYRTCKAKRNSKEVLSFEIDLESNIINLMKQLKNQTYKLGKYHEFTIYEPKKRLIKSLPYRDRIVQQWYVYEFIMPYFVPRFISTSYACIEGRGTHKAVEKSQEYMRKMRRKYGSYYIVKLDIKGFFYNIDKNILFRILQKRIHDEKLLKLTHMFIFDNEKEKGIPIGNYTSQYFANIYLNELDYYVKQDLKVRYYIRYMDDFVLFVKSKEDAKFYYEKIRLFLEEHLKLSLNTKSHYAPNKMGLNFCGFRIFEDYRLLRARFKKKMKKKVKIWNLLFLHNALDMHQVLLEWNSFLAHSNHADSYHFQKKIYESIIFHKDLPFPKYESLKNQKSL